MENKKKKGAGAYGAARMDAKVFNAFKQACVEDNAFYTRQLTEITQDWLVKRAANKRASHEQ